MYELYENLRNNIDFEANACNWMDAQLPNPFKEGTLEREYYSKASRYCRRWRAGGIDCRSARVNMLSYIKKLMDLNLQNPYYVEPKVQVTVTPEEIHEPMTVLGVIPEKKKKIFKKEGAKNDSKRTD